MIRIIIADDHPIFREGLKKIIENNSDLVIVDEVETGEELLNKLFKKNYDVVLLDISMPGIGGMEVLERLKKEKRKIYILVLSMHSEDHYAIHALKSGASGYLTKESAPFELLNAIRKVSTGGKYVSSSLAEKLAFDLENGDKKLLHEKLSNREFQVMCRIASGKTVTEIAKELSLSVSTINSYRFRILKKMYINNNAELTHYAITKGLTDK